MNHRLRVLIAPALAVPFGLAACAGPGEPAPGPGTIAPSPTSAASAAVSTLCDAGTDCPADLLIWADADRAAALVPSVEAFGREHSVVARVQVADGILGRLTSMPDGTAGPTTGGPTTGTSATGTSATGTRSSSATNGATSSGTSGGTSSGTGTVAVPGGTPSRMPDVFVGAHDWLGRLLAKSLVKPVPLPADVAGRFAPMAIRATQKDGVGYGVPHGIENVALIRNTSLAPDAPASMDDLVAKGRELVAAKKAKRVLAQFVSSSGNAYYALPYLTAFEGGGVFGLKANGDYDPTKIIVNSAGSVRGGEALQRLGAAGVLRTDVDDRTMDQLFTSGAAPYLISGPWSAAKAKAANVPYGVSQLPKLTGGGPMRPFVGVQLFYVSATAKSPELAQEFVATWVPRKDVQLALFAAGRRPPALKEAYEEAARTDPEVRAWLEAGANGVLIPSLRVMDEVWKPAGAATVDLITGKAAPKPRLDALQREILQLIARG